MAPKPLQELLGGTTRFGLLTVVTEAPGRPRSGGRTARMVRCVCDCGQEAVVAAMALKGGTRSCGCLIAARASETKRKHGRNKANSRLYRIWSNMRNRCNSVNGRAFERYGARGINICSEWEAFPEFETWALQNGYDECLSIDRINNDKGYSPDNCRWADAKTQANNRRKRRSLEPSQGQSKPTSTGRK